MADATEVKAFLGEFCRVAADTGLTVWPTEKNEAFLLEAGFTRDDVHHMVKRLDPRNYSSGPEPDDNPSRRPGEVWKFSFEYLGFELYMKLKLSVGVNLSSAECLSCHERERNMAEPLRLKRLGAK